MLEQNEVVRQMLWKEVFGFTFEELNRQPAPGKWSAAQVLEHLYLMETDIVQQMEHALQSGVDAKAEPKPFRLILDRTRPMKAAPHLMPGEDPVSLAALMEKLNQSRKKLEEVLHGVEEDVLRNRSFVHPEFGPMDLKQWEELIGVHELRHLEQIKEFRKKSETVIQQLGTGIYNLNLELNGTLIHPVLLWNEQEGATLIDTGMVGTLTDLQHAVQETGVNWNEIRRVILTHQDIDHIGNLPAIVSSLPSMPEIWAHKEDSDVIEGKKPVLKMSAERIASMPAPMRHLLESLLNDLKEIKVTRLLEDGEILPIHGNVQVIHTPGHTPGHLSFYLQEAKLLLAADELTVADGQLRGPNEAFTPDMPLAMKSISKFLPLAIQQILCYHGGVFTQQPEEAIEKLARASQ